jgi:hypothetical protein
MRRILSIASACAVIVTAGCGDNASPGATAPAASSVSESRSWTGGNGGFQYSFDISPRGGAYLIGQYMLVVPANAVCEPGVSSYGAGTWDAPCTAAAGSVHVTVTLLTIGGRDYVDFYPHLRFVPSDDQSHWVTINTWRTAAIGGRGDLRRFSILFSETPGGPLIDESLDDPTLSTHVNVRTGFVWRRVKHFTGYNIYSGLIEDCTPYVDDGCVAIGAVIVDGN